MALDLMKQKGVPLLVDRPGAAPAKAWLLVAAGQRL